MKKFFIIYFLFLFVSTTYAEEKSSKVCALHANKIDISSPPTKLISKLEALECQKGDKVFIFYATGRTYSGKIKHNLMGAQICNFEKQISSTSEQAVGAMSFILCEFTGKVLDISTNDKRIIESLDN